MTAVATWPNWAAAEEAANAASTTAAESSQRLEEIVVTARRRDENAQQTPVAITAFSSQELTRRSISDIEQLSHATPSFNYEASPYDPFGAELGIRGQQATDIVLAQPSPIGIYVDEVYDSSGAALNLLNFDYIQQLQVLKGPQGTLYGRNTTGGAVKITTPLPDYDGVHGAGKIGVGNYADRVVSGTVNLPLINEHLAMNLVGRFENRGGYGTIEDTGRPLNDWQSESFRTTIRLDVTDNLQFLARGWYARAIAAGLPGNLVYVAPGATAGNLATAAQIGALSPTDFGILAGKLIPTPAQLAAFGADINAGYQALSAYIRSPYSQNGFDPSPALLQAFGVANLGIQGHAAEDKTWGGSLAATYHLTPDVYVKSITADSVTERNVQQNTGGSPFLLVQGYTTQQSPRQFSEELQVGGSAFAQALQWVTGYYYFDMRGWDNSSPVLQVVPLGPSPERETADVSDISHAWYAQATYAFTQDVRFTGGLRYTKERTNSISQAYEQILGVGAICQSAAGQPVGPTCINSSPSEFSNWSYTAGPDWQVTPDLMLYAKTSRGFRAGGAGIRSPFLTFRPEKVTDYEAGLKSEWLDHRVRGNLDVYQSNYNDIQRTILLQQPGGGVATGIQNAAKARIRGVELELLGKPLEGLTLSLQGAFTDAGYSEYMDAVSHRDLSRDSFENTPRWQGDLSGTYEKADPLGLLTTTLDFTWKGRVNYQPDNNGVFNGVATSQFTTQGGLGLFNARISQRLKVLNNLTLSIWGRNLADRKYLAHATDVSGQLGYVIAVPGIPRTYGLDVSMDF
jgi:iron complex outermembrane receptor protein